MKSKLKELRELIFKCEEVKKDVLELKFGCKCRNIQYKYEFIITGRENPEEDWKIEEDRFIIYITKHPHHSDPTGVDSYETISNEKYTEIIGRDITLEDVLRALGKKYLTKIGIDGIGIITFVGTYQDKERIIVNYELGKPLQFQSPECIDSLINLLK